MTEKDIQEIKKMIASINDFQVLNKLMDELNIETAKLLLKTK